MICTKLVTGQQFLTPFSRKAPSLLAPKLAAKGRDFIAFGFAPTDEIHRHLSDGFRLR
jgi:hypothetical protein